LAIKKWKQLYQQQYRIHNIPVQFEVNITERSDFSLKCHNWFSDYITITKS